AEYTAGGSGSRPARYSGDSRPGARRRAGGLSPAAGRPPHGTIQRGCRRSSSPGRYQYPVYQRPARAQARGSTADE
ncbi:hypothetical protein ABTD10_20575, partial [Acinetobacter baumannii]